MRISDWSSDVCSSDLQRRVEELSQRLQRLRQQREQAAAQREAVLRDTVAEDELQAAAAVLSETEQRLQQVRAASSAASEATAEARRSEAESRGRLREHEGAQAKLEAEISAIAALLEPAEADMWPPAVEAVTGAPGYEAALGAEIGRAHV